MFGIYEQSRIRARAPSFAQASFPSSENSISEITPQNHCFFVKNTTIKGGCAGFISTRPFVLCH